MCVTPDLPNLQETGSDYSQLVNQFVSGVPTQLQAEGQYKPGFINQSLQGINQTLYGGNGRSGLLQDYQGAVKPLAGAEAAGNAVTRGANVGDVGKLGASAAAAVESVNPEQTALTKALTSTASTQLAAGTQLAPSDVNRITQSVRGDWASRGLGASSPAQLDEATQMAAGGQNLLAQREAAAGAAIGQENQNITMPALSLATSTGSGAGMAQNLLTGSASTAQGAGATLVPTQQLSDTLSTIYNARAAQAISGANNTASLIGGALSY